MIGILHLSDIHIKSEKKLNPVLNRATQIVATIKNDLVECTDLIVVISGDIAYSGLEEEYNLAKSFIEDIMNLLKKETRAYIRLLTVPGNHDCYFEPNSVRDIVLKQAQNDEFEFDEDVIKVLCSTQTNYFEFVKRDIGYWRRRTTINYQSEMLTQYLVNVRGKSIILNCFNSASFSNIKEKPGQLKFPLELYKQVLEPDKENLTISIIHHPLNWMNGSSHRELKNKLIQISDIVLTGHEHVPDSYNVEKTDSSAKFIESGALQDSGNDSSSNFGLIKIDFESKGMNSVHSIYSLDGNHYRRENNNEFKIALIKTVRKTLEISEEFHSWLNEVGAPIAHPRKEEIYLDDLFICPEVQIIENEKNTKEGLINNDVSSEELYDELLCAISGGESAGKTTFLKKIFFYKYSNDLIPIYIEGSKIKKVSYTYLYETLLFRAFKHQYNKTDKEFYRQIDREKIIILIDNFGACPLRENARNEVMKVMKDSFGGVFLTARELIHFDPMQIGSEFGDFTIGKLLELGHNLRKDLIAKWNSLGFPYNPNHPEELNIKNLNSIKVVNDIIQKHFVEPYPIYIITLLQVHDAKSVSLDHGSIGFYYEYLIKHTLNQAVGNKTDTPLYETFMKEFCYFLFEERLNNIHENDFENFFHSFISKKRVSLNYKDLVDNLIKARIIRVFNNQVSLHQPYIYYYFTAIAMADRFEDKKVVGRFHRMLDRIYVQEFEGIILFLSHLSSNSIIIDAIKDKCDSYFVEHPEAELNNDILLMEEVINNEFLPLLESSDEPHEKQNNSSNNESDDKLKELAESEANPDQDVDVVGSLNKFVRAIKTFELLGNIAKINYSWDYEKKEPLIKSTYGLGLRLMTSYFEMIKLGGDELAVHVRQACSEKDIQTFSDIKQYAKAYTMHLAFVAIYGLIRRMSYSFGHAQLRQIFKDLSASDPTYAKKLIEFSVDLHQLGIYPESEIKKYITSSTGFKRPIARLILRNFVYEYTQLYKIEAKQRQQIYDATGIELNTQRKIQGTSKRIK